MIGKHILIGKEPVLKIGGCKSLGGSSPSAFVSGNNSSMVRASDS